MVPAWGDARRAITSCSEYSGKAICNLSGLLDKMKQAVAVRGTIAVCLIRKPIAVQSPARHSRADLQAAFPVTRRCREQDASIRFARPADMHRRAMIGRAEDDRLIRPRIGISVPPVVRGSQRACTTSTDPRSQRSRVSRRAGQVTTRARSAWSGRPAAV
jgi:hypothetical protein